MTAATNPFRRRTAIRIASVTLLLAAVFGPVSWFFEQEHIEWGTVSLAIEESGRMLRQHDAMRLAGPDAAAHAGRAAETITGGLFDIAEIYDSKGNKLAEKLTAAGASLEPLLPRHAAPAYRESGYQSFRLADGRWVMRIFVPLKDPDQGAQSGITGYFEGVRLVPEAQRRQMLTDALQVAAMVCLAALLSGAVIYPVVVHLSTENEHKTREVLDSHISMMEALGRAIAKRDSDTGAHNYRVAWIAARIAGRLGLRGSDMQALIAGSFLHDVGKIGIPDAILLKPARLDADEFAVMRTHVGQGEEIVRGMGWLDGAHAVVAGHHEKWDGSGYPRRVAGADIPLAARIFAVADVFDALCSKRPYKEPMGFAEAMAVLEEGSGSHFDPAVMEAFRPMARQVFDRLAACSEEEARQLLEDEVRRHFAG